MVPTLLLDPHQLFLHLAAQRQIERAQRLVQQQHLRLDGDGAGQRHALALAAGKLVDAAAAEALEPDQPQHLVGAAVALAPSAPCACARPKPTLARTLICGNSA